MHYEDIAEVVTTQKYRSSLGATPAATVMGIISLSLKNDGESSPFARVMKGVFALRKWNLSEIETQPQEDESDTGEQYGIVTSFGMFWRRGAVGWSGQPKLWGIQQIGATPVDFSKQVGIYLLYDAREIVYVGRSTDRPLGRRLYEHTLDRLSTRWDRFSWFGMRKVLENGELGDLPQSLSPDNLIPAMEAVLIEALEPRQNRKRGDDLISVEYMQQADKEIEKKRLKDVFDSMIRQFE